MNTRQAPSAFECLAATVLAFALVGVGEFALLAAQGRVFGGGTGPGLVALIQLVGLTSLTGLFLGIGMAIAVPPMVRTLRPGHWLRTHISPSGSADTAAESLNNNASWWIGGLAAVLPLALVAWVAGRMAHGFNQAAFSGPFVALGAVAGLGLSLVAIFPLRAAAYWILSRIAPQGRLVGLPTPLLPIIGIFIVGALVLLRLTQMDLGAYRLGGLIALAGALALSLILIALRRGRLPLKGGVVSGVLVGLLVGAGVYAIFGMNDAPVARRVIPLEGHLSQLSVLGLRKALDRDGDGYAALLAGGDCDDSNSEIGPHAKEIPGNGIDDNCVGGDAPKGDIAAPKPPPKVAVKVNPEDPEPPKVELPYPPKKHNIVMILIDTLRPDHLGTYGYERPTSPNLDAWAKKSVLFEYAFAQAPNTPRSIPSILTGRYPSRIKWKKRYSNYASLAPENELIFEAFQKAGWRTEVVSSHWYFEKISGIKDGVDQWDNKGYLTIKKSNTQSAAPSITPRLIKRIEALSKAEQPYFVFAHYFEPHGRYMQHKDAKIFGKALMDKYDSEISFVDMHLKPVLDLLDQSPHKDNTIVVICSDHGEGFKEHGFYFHGRTVYNEEIRVPLIIRAPGVDPKRVKTPAALVDIFPTLGAMTGVETPLAMGYSQIPAITGKGKLDTDRVIFMEQLPYPNYKEHIVAAVNQSGEKVIRNLTKNVNEAFKVFDDPLEQKNTLDADPEGSKALQNILLQFIDADPG